MNPPGYSAAPAAPLQVVTHGGVSGQPDGSTVVQYTALNIITEPTKDDLIWSLCNFVYLNPCCLGLVALIWSIKARDQKVAGNLEGARHYGSKARSVNVLSTVLCSLMTLIFIILIFVMPVLSNRYH